MNKWDQWTKLPPHNAARKSYCKTDVDRIWWGY